MLTEALIDTAAREGRAILAAVRAAPEAAIKSCPEWDNTRLLEHVGGVHRFVNRVVSTRATAAPGREATDRAPADTEPWDWYEEGLDELLSSLRDIEPGERVWSWADRRNGGFYHRRMAHENAVHRHDAQAAAGRAAHIDSFIAADGVDEILEVGMRYRGNGIAIDYPDSSMLLHRTDGNSRWFVRAVDSTLLVARNGDAGDRADAILSGPAEDLYLHLWGRPAPALTITGDLEAAAAWSAVAP